MKHLSPTEASKLMFDLLQKVRTSTGGGGQLSLAATTTLFAAMKNPGELQFDLVKEVGGVTAAAISRQIDLLDGKDGKLVWRGSDEQMLARSPNPADRSTAIRETVARILANYPPR